MGIIVVTLSIYVKEWYTLVILHGGDFMDSKQHDELLELLEKSEEDVRNGRVAPIEDTFKELRDMLGSGD